MKARECIFNSTFIKLDTSKRSLSSQIARGSFIALLLVPTLFLMAMCVASPFGFCFVTSFGTSMEPALSDGDIIVVKFLDVAYVKVGDIVTLSSPDGESITHRVIRIEPISSSYLLRTKGDTNLLTEQWEIGANGKVLVLTARLPFGGYIVKGLSSIFARALVISAAIALISTWVFRQRITRGDKQASLGQ